MKNSLQNHEKLSDPLELKHLKTLIDNLHQNLSNNNNSVDIENLKSLVSTLSKSINSTTERYNFLLDRYLLLKRSNAALSDELNWLRDQLDDLHPQYDASDE
ncbi:MAG: hypothetical protein JXR91_09950 [Deltaproteobacteria bacterium]|nr:hypothetical protein [Deltaproteobacteria bacterium]